MSLPTRAILAAALGAALRPSSAPAQGPPLPPKALVAQQVDSIVRARLADPKGPASISVMIVRAVGIEVTLENGTLYGAAGGGGKLPLVLQSGTTYYVGSAGAARTVTFTIGADGRATALVLRQGNNPERTFSKVR